MCVCLCVRASVCVCVCVFVWQPLLSLIVMNLGPVQPGWWQGSETTSGHTCGSVSVAVDMHVRVCGHTYSMSEPWRCLDLHVSASRGESQCAVSLWCRTGGEEDKGTIVPGSQLQPSFPLTSRLP